MRRPKATASAIRYRANKLLRASPLWRPLKAGLAPQVGRIKNTSFNYSQHAPSLQTLLAGHTRYGLISLAIFPRRGNLLLLEPLVLVGPRKLCELVCWPAVAICASGLGERPAGGESGSASMASSDGYSKVVVGLFSSNLILSCLLRLFNRLPLPTITLPPRNTTITSHVSLPEAS